MGRKKRSKATEAAVAALKLNEPTPQSDLPEWGQRIEFSEYLSIDRVSSHALMDFNKSPRLYKRKRDGFAPQISSDAFSLGTAAHVYILEGSDVFSKQYHVGGPINASTGKPLGKTSQAYKQFAEEKAREGLTILTESDYATIIEMHAATLANEKVQALLSEGQAEVSILHTLSNNMQVKQRLDWLNYPEWALDLKTTRSLAGFEEDFWRYQYDIQVGMYGVIMRDMTGSIPDFYVLACEKQEPYACRLYSISADTMWASMKKVRRLLWDLEGCIADDDWPYGTEVEGTI